MRRGVVAVLLLGWLVAAEGCAPGALSYDRKLAPDGSSRRVHGLRGALMRGEVKNAQERMSREDAGAGDALLVELERGIVALYTGDPVAASGAFDRAYWIDEARATHSLSNGLEALVTSDFALPFRPGQTERAMLHYYAALSWLARGRADEAAVDARRLSALLARAEDNEDPLADDLTEVLREFAATVYEAAGDWEAADVERRLLTGNREPGTGTSVSASGSLVPGPSSPSCDSCGTLVLVIDRGFTTHRVPQSLGIAFADGDLAIVGGLKDDPAGIGAAVVALDRATTPRYCGWSRHAVCGRARRKDFHGSVTMINIAWPELAAPRRLTDALTLMVGDHVVDVGRGADVSESIAADFSRGSAARMARAAGRVVVRQAMLKAGEEAFEKADDEKKKKNDKSKNAWRAVGVAALAAGVASSFAERADTRSWTLLPDEIAVERVSLPAGTYTIRRAGIGGEAVREVEVRAGMVTVLPLRDWGSRVQ